MENLKPLLTTYAYNILGTIEDAKDVVQDAFLKYHLLDKENVQNEKAYLTRMVINLAINLKKRLHKSITEYPGQWLPEPVSTQYADGDMDKHEILSYSLMVLLEKLNPRQRAVFILKEAFDYEHEEIAEVIGITPDNSRQLLTRAKKTLHKSDTTDNAKVNAENLDKYLQVIQSEDTEKLEELLNEEIAVISDGGGKRVAFVNPIIGKKSVTALLAGVYKKFYKGMRIEKGEINHQPAIFYYDNDELVNCQVLIFNKTNLINIFFVRNPDKLKSLQKILV